MKISLPVLLMLALFISVGLSCASEEYTPEQQQELQVLDFEQEEAVEGFTDVLTLARGHSEQMALLLQKSWNDSATDTEKAELAVLIGTAPLSLQESVGDASYFLNNWKSAQDRKVEIEKDVGGNPIWPWIGSIGTLLLGMGFPTSGPMGRVLARTAPFLELIKFRNPAVRRQYHETTYADTPPV